jgi:hypothetical protein
VRLHELVQPDRGEDLPAVRELGAIEMVDVQELALVEHTEIAEQPLDHLALGEHPDR